MFLSDSHLPQLLPPSCYADEQFARQELTQLFVPAWHYAGSLAELHSDGNFSTATILDRPVILWRQQGELHAFLNVCAHRFSKLTDQPCGRAERLTCQYHGWQYDASGDTQKIPDSQNFRPLAGQRLGLTRLPLVVAGQLALVNFTGQSPANSPMHRHANVFERLFGPRSSLVFSMQREVPANWKVVIENAVESYHVGFVHEASFGQMPSAESCTHELANDYTRFVTDAPSQASRLVQRLERLVHRLLGRPFVERYEHYHFFPNLTIATSKMFSAVMAVEPLSPGRSRLTLQLFGDPGERRNLAARAAFRLASRFAAKEVAKVIDEDLAVLPSIQQGLQSPDLPAGGLISIREERVHHFQQWVQQRIGPAAELA